MCCVCFVENDAFTKNLFIVLIQNQQITEYTTNPLSQVSTSLTKYEIIVSVKDEEDNTTTKSEIVTLSSNAPQATITEFEPILVEIVNYPTSKNVGPIIVSASAIFNN